MDTPLRDWIGSSLVLNISADLWIPVQIFCRTSSIQFVWMHFSIHLTCVFWFNCFGCTKNKLISRQQKMWIVFGIVQLVLCFSTQLFCGYHFDAEMEEDFHLKPDTFAPSLSLLPHLS